MTTKLTAPLSSPNFRVYRENITVSDSGPYTNEKRGLNCDSYSRLLVQVAPKTNANPTVKVYFWNSAKNSFVYSHIACSNNGPGVAKDFSIDVLNRRVFLELSGSLVGGVDILVAGDSSNSGSKEASDSTLAQLLQRAPLRNEIMIVPVTTSSVTWNIPDGSIANQPDWRGKFVDFYAETSAIHIQFSNGTDASVDELADSVTSTVDGRPSITASGNECITIGQGQSRSWPIPYNCRTFAVKSSASGKLRTHLSQS